MNLIHLANVNSTNVGNGALIWGLERVLAEDLPQARIARVAWDDYTFEKVVFDRGFVEMVNRSDGLIVNGAVAINGRAYLRNAGFRLDLPLALWREIEKPVVLFGLSYRHWKGQPFHHQERLAEVVGFILDHPRMILGLRNDGTCEWLSNLLGIAAERFAEVPDTGLFVEPEDGPDPEILPGRLNVVLAVNNEDEVERYAGSRKAAVLDGIVKALVHLAERHDANLILAPHYLDDFRMIGEIFERLPPRIAHQHVITTGLARVSGARRFYGRYAKADLVLAMRVHAMSPSIGMGVPLVVLSSQGRMSTFLKKVGLGDIAVDIFGPAFAEELVAAVERTLAASAETRARLLAAADRQRAETRRFMDRVRQIL